MNIKSSAATLKARVKLARKKTVLLSTLLRNMSNGTYILADEFNKDDLPVLLQCHITGQAKLLGCMSEMSVANESMYFANIDTWLARVVKQLVFWPHFSGNYNHPIPASLTAYDIGKASYAESEYTYFTTNNMNMYNSNLLYGRARLAACGYLSRRLEYKKEYDLKIPTKLVLHLFNVISPLDIVSK